MIALICWMRHEAIKRGKTVDESHNAFSENIGCLLILQGNAHPSKQNTLIFAGKYQRDVGRFAQESLYQCSCFRAKAAHISGHLPYRGTNGNSSYIFSAEKCTFIIKYSKVWK